MVSKFGVPKFITIEDRLAGLFTFRQLFALLGAFLLTFFIFRFNQSLGIIVGIISFSLAATLTFVYINGKPLMQIFPNVLDFLFRGRKYIWQRIEKTIYKEVEIPETEEKISFPSLRRREKKITGDKISLDIDYPEVAPNFRERVIISLNEPIINQAEEISKIVHRHLANPRNPYRLFPYIKFYRSFK